MTNNLPVFLVYRLFYVIFHGFYTIFEIIHDYFLRCTIEIHSFYHQFFTTKNNTKPTAGFLGNLTKVPRHVTVILGPEEPHLPALTDLVAWSLAARIPFISFHDHKGCLERKAAEFQHQTKLKIGTKCHVMWHQGGPSDAPRNGFVGPKIHVKVLSSSGKDGQEAIVALARDLVVKTDKDIQQKVKDVTSSSDLDYFNSQLRWQYEFPDPDVGLCYGPTMCLYGYPPWQVRVTEFFKAKQPQYRFRMNDFVEVLLSYNRCEQRLGK